MRTVIGILIVLSTALATPAFTAENRGQLRLSARMGLDFYQEGSGQAAALSLDADCALFSAALPSGLFVGLTAYYTGASTGAYLLTGYGAGVNLGYRVDLSVIELVPRLTVGGGALGRAASFTNTTQGGLYLSFGLGLFKTAGDGLTIGLEGGYSLFAGEQMKYNPYAALTAGMVFGSK